MIYTASYHALDESRPEAGQIRILPWDHAIFGFPVGEYKLADASGFRRYREEVAVSLDRWAARENVRLVSCEADAADFESMLLLQECGFRYVDTSLNAVTHNIQALKIPQVKLPIRPAESRDRDAIAAIASGSFQFGRYHQDPAFPVHLARERYRQWIHNAMDATENNERIYVFTIQGTIAGFFHLVVDGTDVDLRLGGIDVRYQGSIYGVGLFSQTFMRLREEGMIKVSARISAINTEVINLYGAMGFKFADPHAIFHRHYGLGGITPGGAPANSSDSA